MTEIREIKFHKPILEVVPHKILGFVVGTKTRETTWPVLEGCWCEFCTGKKEIFEGTFTDKEWCRHQVFCEVTERAGYPLTEEKLAELKKQYENSTWIPMAGYGDYSRDYYSERALERE